MGDGGAATTHDTRLLELNADCAEFCPVEGHEHLLGIGTYQLVEEEQTRVGRLHVYTVAGGGGGKGPALEEHSTFDLSGIFDMKWKPACGPDGRPRIAFAGADGTLALCSVLEGAVEEVARESDAGGGSMCLSLDWSAHEEGRVAVSSHNGGLCLLQEGEGGLEVVQLWHGHDMEAWICAFSRTDSHVLFSGADDCMLKVWDVRAGGEDGAAYTNRKAHGAGVCSIQSSPHAEHLLCTGSYDEHVRLWDTRMMEMPLMKAKVGTGGGVWRVKWHPRDPELILTASMHNGFAIVRVTGAGGGGEGASGAEVVETYQEHGMGTMLGYGADWYRGPPLAGEGMGGCSLAATASFYDKKAHLWSAGSV